MDSPILITLNPSNGILELRPDDKVSGAGGSSSLSSISSSSSKTVWCTTLDIRTAAVTTISKDNGFIDSYIAFKIKVTAHQRYAVKPSTGWIKCGETITVRINTTENITSNDTITNDKFLVECKCIRGEDIVTYCSSLSRQSIPSITMTDPTVLWSFTKAINLPKLRVYSIKMSTTTHTVIPIVSNGSSSGTKSSNVTLATTTTTASPRISQPEKFETPQKANSNASLSTSNITPPVTSPALITSVTGSSPSSLHNYNSILPKAPVRVPNGQLIKWCKGPLIGKGAFGIVHMGILTDITIHSGTYSSIDRTDGSLNGRPVAIKEIPLTMPSAWASACREAVALTICNNHPNIPKLYGLSRMKPSINSPLERAALIMEYVPGGTLAQLASAWANGDQQLLKSPYTKQQNNTVPSGKKHDNSKTMIAKGLPESAVQAYIRELLHGVIVVHQQGIAHRDIKGANLLLSSDGRVLLGDFGSCKLMPGIVEAALTGSGLVDNVTTNEKTSTIGNTNGTEWDEVLGTSRYANGEQPRSAREQGTLQWMAPEVVTTGLKLTRITSPNIITQPKPDNSSSPSTTSSNTRPRITATVDTVQWWQQADIWSVGCTVLELLTARPPWFGIANDSAEVQIHIASTDLRDRLPSWLSTNARTFITACLHPDGNNRPTAEELLKYPFITSPAKDADDEAVNSSTEETVDEDSDLDSQEIEIGDTTTFGKLYALDSLTKSSLVPMESLKNCCNKLERLQPLIRLGCRQAWNWSQKHPHRGNGPMVDWLNNCTCFDETLLADSAILQYQDQQIQMIAAYYSEGFDDDLVGYIAEDVGLIATSALPHLSCFMGFIFNTWVIPMDYNDTESVDIRYSAMYSELELLYFVAASNTCVRLTEKILPSTTAPSPKNSKINKALILSIEQLEDRLLNSVCSRMYYWINRSTLSSIDNSIIESTAGSDNASVLHDDTMKPTLWNLALLKSWYLAAKLRIQNQSYCRNIDNSNYGQHLDEQDEEAWYTETPNGIDNVDYFGTVSDAQPLWDAGYSCYHMADLHCWIFELKGCMKILYNIRRSREQRYSFGITSNMSVSLPDYYLYSERKVYSTFLWLRNAWGRTSSSVGLSSENIDPKVLRKSRSSRKFRNISSAREYSNVSLTIPFSPSRNEGKEYEDENNDTESSLELDNESNNESKDM